MVTKGERVLHAKLLQSDSMQPYGLQPARLLCPWDLQRDKLGDRN